MEGREQPGTSRLMITDAPRSSHLPACGRMTWTLNGWLLAGSNGPRHGQGHRPAAGGRIVGIHGPDPSRVSFRPRLQRLRVKRASIG